MRRHHLLAAAIAAALVRPGAADPLDLGSVEDVEELSLADLLERPVVAASRYEQAPGDSPTLVSTVDADLIQRMAYRTIGEALRGVRGVYLSNDRNYSYLGVRGFSIPGDYNTRLAMSIDGHRVNDVVYQQAPPGAELGLPMIAIDHLEMIRGGAWSVYGQSALLGAVQIVTASGASRPGLRVEATSRAAAETFDDPAHRPTLGWRGQDLAASYGAVRGGVDVFAAAGYLFDPGMSAIYTPDLADPALTCVDDDGQREPCDGVVRDADGEQAGSAYLVVRAHRLTLHALAARRWKRVPTASFVTLIGDRGLETLDDRAYADAEYHVEHDRSDVIARVAADYYRFAGDYPYDVGDGTTLPASRELDREHARGLSLSTELRGRYKLPRVTSWLTDVELAGGGEAALAYANQFGDYDDVDPPYLDRADRDRSAALSAQASARAFHRVVGFAAVRGDSYTDGSGLTVNPQGGLVLDGGAAGRWRASYARGFRAPNPYERFFFPANQDRATGALRPEHSQTVELSYERFFGDHVRAQVVGYLQDISDLIALHTEGEESWFENRAGVDGGGVESELEGRWGRLRLRASYAWQTASPDGGGAQVNSPHSLGYVSLLAPIAGGRADLALETTYIGERLSSKGAAAPAAFVTNLAVTVPRVTEAVDLTIGATNLFDTRGGDPGSEDHRQGVIARDPRTLWLRLALELGR